MSNRSWFLQAPYLCETREYFCVFQEELLPSIEIGAKPLPNECIECVHVTFDIVFHGLIEDISAWTRYWIFAICIPEIRWFP